MYSFKPKMVTKTETNMQLRVSGVRESDADSMSTIKHEGRLLRPPYWSTFKMAAIEGEVKRSYKPKWATKIKLVLIRWFLGSENPILKNVSTIKHEGAPYGTVILVKIQNGRHRS